MSDLASTYRIDDHLGLGPRQVYRPSALGVLCWREFTALRIGVRPASATSEKLQQWFSEGHLHEPDVIARLRYRYGLDILAPEDQETVELDFPSIGVLLRGHIDGRALSVIPEPWPTNDMLRAPDADIVRSYAYPRVVEVKARSKDMTLKWIAGRFDAIPSMRWQVSIYMHATNLPGLICTKDRNSGALDIWPVDEPPMSVDEIGSKLAEIEMMSLSARPDGSGLPDCGDSRRYPCSVHWLCTHKLAPVASSAATDGNAATFGDPRDDMMPTLLADYHRTKLALDAAKAEHEAAKEKLLNVVGTDADSWDGGGDYELAIKRTVTNIPDTTALKAHFGEDYARYLKPSPRTTVTVKPKESSQPT